MIWTAFIFAQDMAHWQANVKKKVMKFRAIRREEFVVKLNGCQLLKNYSSP
jgi:hypothetical protein